MQRIYYNAQTPTQRKRKEKQTIVKKMVNVHIQNTYEMINVDLQVPPLLPTDFSTNSIINVTYYVFVCKLATSSMILIYEKSVLLC